MQKNTQSIDKQTTTQNLGVESGQQLNIEEAPEGIKVKDKLSAQCGSEQNQTRLTANHPKGKQ